MCYIVSEYIFCICLCTVVYLAFIINRWSDSYVDLLENLSLSPFPSDSLSFSLSPLSFSLSLSLCPPLSPQGRGVWGERGEQRESEREKERGEREKERESEGKGERERFSIRTAL